MLEIPEPWDFTEESCMRGMNLAQEICHVGHREGSYTVETT